VSGCFARIGVPLWRAITAQRSCAADYLPSTSWFTVWRRRFRWRGARAGSVEVEREPDPDDEGLDVTERMRRDRASAEVARASG
jgi:hypothetical protein